jgi:hypothetical protein
MSSMILLISTFTIHTFSGLKLPGSSNIRHPQLAIIATSVRKFTTTHICVVEDGLSPDVWGRSAVIGVLCMIRTSAQPRHSQICAVASFGSAQPGDKWRAPVKNPRIDVIGDEPSSSHSTTLHPDFADSMIAQA